MKQKVISIEQAVDMVYDGMSIMVGGFLGCGNPNKIIDALVKKQVNMYVEVRWHKLVNGKYRM